MTIRKEFLGRGWAFPFHFDPASGGVAMSEYEENIRQSITLILGTKPGERPMLPEFGCRIHQYLFAPNTHATGNMIAHHVEKALKRWEPRINVEGVRARTGQQGEVRVEVDYKIISTNSRQNLVHVLTNKSGR
jgi:phage baseplate assembly protein W